MALETLYRKKLKSGILGLCVADALGVPVEFESRASLQRSPVVDMRGYGTYNQPPGTWSDDTSLALCLLDSLANGLDYADIMHKFLLWIDKAEYTPHGKVFDVGRTCRRSILRFSKGTEPTLCGGASENDNGNGSLMRILPLAFHINSMYGDDYTNSEDACDIIHNVSALTHAHNRSKIACGLYISIAGNLIRERSTISGKSGDIYSGLNKAKEYYKARKEYVGELEHYGRIFNDGFIDLPQEKIKSSGYVVDTLEAAIWCLLNTDNYKSCVLKAVNLGGDTDTVAAVAGGLAGLCYGFDAIPSEWIKQIARLDYIQELCESFCISLDKAGIQKLCSYIPYFENIDPDKACQWEGGGTSEDGVLHLSYPMYDDEFEKFIDVFNESGLSVYNYQSELDQRIPGWKTENINEVIESADYELLMVILTKCIRVERFCVGAWDDAIRSGFFLCILRKLHNWLVNKEQVMPIEIGIWRVDKTPQQVQPSTLNAESRLEEWIVGDISLIDPDLLVIGRQVATTSGGKIDILAMDSNGNLVVIELKRDKTPREVVAQILDYASWVRNLGNLGKQDIANRFKDFQEKWGIGQHESFDDAYRHAFENSSPPEEYNGSHSLIIVAAELDESTERIVTYLSVAHSVPINAVFFRFFKDGDREYFTRAWLIDPDDIVIVDRGGSQWNGEFYASLGRGRNWDCARKYGYISAGGKDVHSRRLDLLEPGARVWVNFLGHGYTGVAIVKEKRVPADDFMVHTDKGEVPIKSDPGCDQKIIDMGPSEYLVRVEWKHSVPLGEAVKESGFFGNRNTVCRPKDPKWKFTLERLKAKWGIVD